MEKLGIIAGAGDLPILLAQAVRDQGRSPVVIQIAQTPTKQLTAIASEVSSAGIGQVQKVTKRFLDSGVREVAIIGKIEKSTLLHPFRMDATAIKILAKARGRGVSAIVAGVLNHFESKGLTVIEQHRFLKGLMPQPGVLTKRQPSKSQWQDLRYAMQLARQIANLDIGQTVVVKKRVPIAVEALEGTDETIKRGGQLAGKGVIVAKAAATHHDFRVDVPTVGSRTLEVLHAIRASVLAVEAERTFVMNQKVLCEQADRWGISIVAMQ